MQDVGLSMERLQMLSYLSSKINKVMKREAGDRSRWQKADIWQKTERSIISTAVMIQPVFMEIHHNHLLLYLTVFLC